MGFLPEVSSFELLSSCLDTEAERCHALTKALQSLAWQAPGLVGFI